MFIWFDIAPVLSWLVGLHFMTFGWCQECKRFSTHHSTLGPNAKSTRFLIMTILAVAFIWVLHICLQKNFLPFLTLASIGPAYSALWEVPIRGNGQFPPGHFPSGHFSWTYSPWTISRPLPVSSRTLSPWTTSPLLRLCLSIVYTYVLVCRPI